MTNYDHDTYIKWYQMCMVETNKSKKDIYIDKKAKLLKGMGSC